MGAVATCFLLADSSPTWIRTAEKLRKAEKNTTTKRQKVSLLSKKSINILNQLETSKFKKKKNFHSESLGFMAIAPKNHGISSHW